MPSIQRSWGLPRDKITSNHSVAFYLEAQAAVVGGWTADHPASLSECNAGRNPTIERSLLWFVCAQWLNFIICANLSGATLALFLACQPRESCQSLCCWPIFVRRMLCRLLFPSLTLHSVSMSVRRGVVSSFRLCRARAVPGPEDVCSPLPADGGPPPRRAGVERGCGAHHSGRRRPRKGTIARQLPVAAYVRILRPYCQFIGRGEAKREVRI